MAYEPADNLTHSLPAHQWPLVVAALRHEGSAESVAVADHLEEWLEDIKFCRSKFLQAMKRLHGYDAAARKRKKNS